MPDQRRAGLVLGSVFLLLALLLPPFFINRTQSGWLMLSYVVAFAAYLVIWKSPYANWLLLVGVLARVGLFFALPMLSDDVYRFLWDGFLLKNDVHPFAELPGFYLNQNMTGLSQELYDQLNSQAFFTVYPPINQGIFWLAVTISEDWLIASGVIRLFLFGADLLAFYFLRKLLLLKGVNVRLAFLYFLNPLVIWEGVGNLHFEGMVVAFLAMAFYYFYRGKSMLSGASLGLAIGTKLLPLIFLPFFFLKEIKGRKISLTVSAVLVALTSLLPLLDGEFFMGICQSIGLYFTNFEFNGSLFAVARELSIWVTGYNQIKIIGPIFSVISAGGILVISWVGNRKDWDAVKTLLFVLSLYLILTTTVHPWYILPLILFGILSGHIFPIVWSLMVFVTYVGYSEDGHCLHWAWIVMEYVVVGLSFVFNDKLKKWLIIS